MDFDILLLDDEDAVAAVRGSLGEDGFSIRAVRTGVEAFAAVMESHPDMVAADVEARGGETRKLYQVMRHLTAVRTIPFLFLGSAADSPGMAEDDLRLPADDFLKKPFLPSEFREKVERLRGAVGEGGPERPTGPPGVATCSVREVLVDTIEFLVATGRTGTLTIAGGGTEGRLSIEKGVLRHASFETFRGEEALLRLLRLEGVEVNFREGGEALVPNIDIDWKTFAFTHC
jgi:CheY-like chemotaxis protein